MASLTNRSNFLVTVEDEPSLTERFPFSESTHAKSYLRELKKRTPVRRVRKGTRATA